MTVHRILTFFFRSGPRLPKIVGAGRENERVTTVAQDPEQARIDGLLESLRAAEVEYRQSYARVLDVVAESDAERVGAATGFGTTARLVAGVLNLSPGEARVRAEHAELLTTRRSLTGEVLPPALPATAAELVAGSIGPGHLRVITATVRRIPATTHPEEVAQAERTLAQMARRFDPSALSRLAERLLAHLDPDGTAPHDEPEEQRELRFRTGPDGTVNLAGRLDPEGGARVREVLGSLNGRRPPIDGVPDARRLACDAVIITLVLDGDSLLLDVGREQRLTTPVQRTALAQRDRDKGCAFPSCDRAPHYCHAHHLISWLDGGTTTLTNLCLLCEYHHVMAHRQGWHIRIDGRGRPEFTPPKAIDPEQRPLHNPLRQ